MNRETIKGRWSIQSWEQLYDDGRVVCPMDTDRKSVV